MAHSEIQVVTKEEKMERASTLPLLVSASESGGEKLADVSQGGMCREGSTGVESPSHRGLCQQSL